VDKGCPCEKITGRIYRLKDYAAITAKEDKNKKSKSKPDEPSTAEPASLMDRYRFCSFYFAVYDYRKGSIFAPNRSHHFPH
jgi:hypothetical protein